MAESERRKCDTGIGPDENLLYDWDRKRGLLMNQKVVFARSKRIIFLILACMLAETAFANGLGGERLEKVVGDLIVDIGTDQPSTPVAGQPIEFDFGLLQSDTRESVSLATSVGIDISHNGKSMVNCDLIAEEPMTFLYYTFPESGTYTLKVTFFDSKRAKQDLATASFPLTISGPKSNTRALYITALVASILLGLLAGFWAARRRTATIQR